MNKAVLFNIDEVLMPSYDISDNAIYHSMISMINEGLPEKNPEQAVKYFREIREYNEGHRKSFHLLCKFYGVKGNRIVEAGLERYEEVRSATLQASPNARSTLDYLLDQGFKLGILGVVSELGGQWEKIKSVGLDLYFKSSCSISCEKMPSSKFYSKALEKLNVSPKDSFYVGNRLDVDIQGAHNAGMKGILLLCEKYAGQSPVSLLLKKGINEQEILEGKYDKEIKEMTPEYTINDLSDIKNIL